MLFEHDSESFLFEHDSGSFFFEHDSEPLLFEHDSEPFLFEHDSEAFLFEHDSESFLFEHDSESFLFEHDSGSFLFEHDSESFLFEHDSESFLLNTIRSRSFLNTIRSRCLRNSFHGVCDPMLGDLQRNRTANGHTSCLHVNNIHIAATDSAGAAPVTGVSARNGGQMIQTSTGLNGNKNNNVMSRNGSGGGDYSSENRHLLHSFSPIKVHCTMNFTCLQYTLKNLHFIKNKAGCDFSKGGVHKTEGLR